MITVTESFSISFGTAPYEYSIITADPCLTVSNPTGTSTDGSIPDIVFSAMFDTCFPVNITVNVQDSSDNPCVKEFVFPITSPCTSFQATLSQTDVYSFSYTANQAVSDVLWDWDNDLFSADFSRRNAIDLTLKRQPGQGETSVIAITVFNGNNCQSYQSLPISFPTPTAGNVEKASPCIPHGLGGSFSSTGFFPLPVTSSDPIDWSTLVVETPPEFNYELNNANEIKITRTSTVNTGGSFTIAYTVATTKGIVSNKGFIAWAIKDCETLDDIFVDLGPFGNSSVINISADQIGDVIEIPIAASKPYNPSLSEFIPSPDQTVSGDGKTLTTVEGEAILYDDHFTYEQINLVPTVESEPIQYQLTDYDNNKGPVVKTSISLQTLPAPNVQNKSICTSCFTPTPFLDLFDVDLGDDLVDPSTILLKVAPTLGTIKTASDGSVSYTQVATASGAGDTMEFTWRDYNNVLSNTAVFSIQRDCPGKHTAVTDITCTAKVFNLSSLQLASHWIGAGGYEEVNSLVSGSYTDQGGVVTDPLGVGGVDFTAIDPGTYTFKRAVLGGGGFPPLLNCPLLIEDVFMITFTASPSLTITGSTLVSGTTYQVNFTITGVGAPSDITVEDDGSPANIVISPSFIGTAGQVTITLDPGANTVDIEAATICAGTVSDSVVIVA